jgi:hypothetical protein
VIEGNMSEAIWYFADGDVERGPVTEAQLRTLIGTGNLTREDLVWKEGLEDWLPAGEVPSLFDATAAPPSTETSKSKSVKAVVKPDETPATAAAKAAEKMAPSRASTFDVSKPLELFRWVAFLGQPLLLVGFVVILGARGCDVLGDRQVVRVTARIKLLENEFQDQSALRKAELEQSQKELREKQDPSPVDLSALETVTEQLSQLNRDRQEELDKLRSGEWSDLVIAARDAEASNHVSAFWRAGAFWLGSFVFALGLWIVGFSGKPPERWMCLVMLAVIVFSLFVGRLGP